MLGGLANGTVSSGSGANLSSGNRTSKRAIVNNSHFSAGGNATLHFNSLADMTTEMHAAFFGLGTAANGFAGVVPVGDAFPRAVNDGLVLGSGFYNAQGSCAEPSDGTMNLGWLYRTHASV